MPTLQVSYGWFFSNVTKAEVRHKCLNSDSVFNSYTSHRFEQRLAPARESEVRSFIIAPVQEADSTLRAVLGSRNMGQRGTSVQNLPHVTLASSLQESWPAMSTVFTTEEPSHTNLVRGDLRWPPPPSSALM
jgi:hypothetical protein